jgi:hypothetical protein
MPAHTHRTSSHPQSPVAPSALKVKTRIKAGGLASNHSETLVQASHPAAGLRVKTHVKAGGLAANHNETLVKASPPTKGPKVKAQIKAESIVVHDEGV